MIPHQRQQDCFKFVLFALEGADRVDGCDYVHFRIGIPSFLGVEPRDARDDTA